MFLLFVALTSAGAILSGLYALIFGAATRKLQSICGLVLVFIGMSFYIEAFRALETIAELDALSYTDVYTVCSSAMIVALPFVGTLLTLQAMATAKVDRLKRGYAVYQTSIG